MTGRRSRAGRLNRGSGPFRASSRRGGREAALGRILGEPIALTVAGRTDAGVHAWGQVASFALDREPPSGLLRSVNSVLPGEISVLEATPAPDGFDARRDARSRTYCYWIV